MVRPTADGKCDPSPPMKERGILVRLHIAGGEDDVDICI